MAMWADNVKFVKDIIDSKYAKIDTAVAEVMLEMLTRWNQKKYDCIRFCS